MDFCKALIPSLEVKFLSFQNIRMKVRMFDSFAEHAIKTKDYRIFEVNVKSKRARSKSIELFFFAARRKILTKRVD
jgi:hypothetical protein